MTIGKRRLSPDFLSLLLLVGLCWLFFWRLLTPVIANQQSLITGDFSGQFVAFAQYQAERLAQGQIPLWNPYNMGGHPFLADTQSAVFYPPRLLTIAALNLTGGSNGGRMYDALQREMIAHTLLASLLMYAFVRRLTRRNPHNPHSIAAALVSALTFAYGGYLTGYPQLQLAVLEAGIWLPLTLLGIHEATERADGRWYALSGLALGLSFLAGHPQTTLFLGYASLAYLGWRIYSARRPLRDFVIGAAIFGLVGVGLAAVQLLPGLEYQSLTSRAALTFDERGNGFPFYDVLQVIFPGLFSLWSPLYFGILGLLLAIYAVFRRVEGYLFWAILIVAAGVLSFGSRTVLFDFVYNLIPGFSWFRGQERAAYLVATGTAVLAGLGTPALLRAQLLRRHALLFALIAIPPSLLFAVSLMQWLGGESKHLPQMAFSLVFTLIALAAFVAVGRGKGTYRAPLLIGFVVFELFSFGRANPNVESKPTRDRISVPPLVQTIKNDTTGVYRVQWPGLARDNFATLYGLQDVDGISPLRLDRVNNLNDARLFPNLGRMWELFAVRYVLAPENQLSVPSKIIAQGFDGHSTVNLHQISNPRPFARLVYKTWIEPNDDAARGYLSDPSFDARNTVMLAEAPNLTLPTPPANANGSATVTAFAPESITIRTASTNAAILEVALVNYPGWSATIDGQSVALLRADLAFSAVAVPAGDHTVQFTFAPRLFSIGALLSLATGFIVILLIIFGGRLAFIAQSR